MELLHPRCAGIDISKRDAKVCVRSDRRIGAPAGCGDGHYLVVDDQPGAGAS
jgi:hypothetical protein